jgi:hypothetical protein
MAEEKLLGTVAAEPHVGSVRVEVFRGDDAFANRLEALSKEEQAAHAAFQRSHGQPQGVWLMRGIFRDGGEWRVVLQRGRLERERGGQGPLLHLPQ